MASTRLETISTGFDSAARRRRRMSRRGLRRSGAPPAVGAAIAMTAYSLTVGADHADPLIRALGALTGLTGLALIASTGGRSDRRDGGS